MGVGGVLEVWAFHDGVDGAGLLAVPAVDALGHVDVVPDAHPNTAHRGGNSTVRKSGYDKLWFRVIA